MSEERAKTRKKVPKEYSQNLTKEDNEKKQKINEAVERMSTQNAMLKHQQNKQKKDVKGVRKAVAREVTARTIENTDFGQGLRLFRKALKFIQAIGMFVKTENKLSKNKSITDKAERMRNNAYKVAEKVAAQGLKTYDEALREENARIDRWEMEQKGITPSNQKHLPKGDVEKITHKVTKKLQKENKKVDKATKDFSMEGKTESLFDKVVARGKATAERNNATLTHENKVVTKGLDR